MGNTARDKFNDLTKKNKLLECDNKKLKQEINELVSVNDHLKLYPGTDYEAAMNDYIILSTKN